VSLYIHVPFCVRRCSYCDFYSCTDLSAREAFQHALVRQIASLPRPESIPSVYFGGGTPSLLASSIADILDTVRRYHTLTDTCEITVEVNPESFTAELCDTWRRAGVNRVSIGVQSIDDATLKTLGRVHNADRARAAVQLAHASGFETSVDLMCAIPGHEAAFTDSLQWAADCGARHISVYPLTVGEDTALAARIQRGDAPAPDSDTAADQMLLAERVLTGAGFEHYEIANYARPGARARHNLRYWQPGAGTGDYLGLGPAAWSMRNRVDGGRERFALHRTLREYLDDQCVSEPGVPITGPAETGESGESGALDGVFDVLTAEAARREDLMLAMRVADGVAAGQVQAAGLSAVFEDLVARGLVELFVPDIDPGDTSDTSNTSNVRSARDSGSHARGNTRSGARYRCTQTGWLLGNEVFAAILP
jgi:oxygen-independent coproporphyrinogen-3 oxidase